MSKNKISQDLPTKNCINALIHCVHTYTKQITHHSHNLPSVSAIQFAEAILKSLFFTIINYTQTSKRTLKKLKVSYFQKPSFYSSHAKRISRVICSFRESQHFILLPYKTADFFCLSTKNYWRQGNWQLTCRLSGNKSSQTGLGQSVWSGTRGRKIK